MILGNSNSGLSNRFFVVHIYSEHRICPQKIHKQNGKTGVTAMVTPVSYPFEQVITAFKATSL
jgi:hypothetical protein